MSFLKSLKKTGVHKISKHLSVGNSSKVCTISNSKIPKKEKTLLPKCSLVDKELLVNDVREAKTFKKIRKSSLASTSRKKLLALDVAFANTWKNVLNADEKKSVGKKIDDLQKRISHGSNLPEKLRSTSTKFLINDGKSLALNNIAGEVIHSNDKSDGKPYNVFKKKKVRDSVHGNYLNAEGDKITKRANCVATSEGKGSYEIDLQPFQHERLKIVKVSEIGQGKWDISPLNMKCNIKHICPINSILKSPSRSKWRGFTTRRSGRIATTTKRRSRRIAGMEKISYKQLLIS